MMIDENENEVAAPAETQPAEQPKTTGQDSSPTATTDTGDDKATRDTLLSGDGTDLDDSAVYKYTPAEDAEPLSEAEQIAVEKFGEFAKEKGIDPNNFTDLVDYHRQAMQQASDAYSAELSTQWDTQIEQWRDESLKHSELGNSSAEKLNESVGYANKAIEKFGSPELRTLMSKPTENTAGLGIGNHPAVLLFCARIGRAMSDDSNPIIEGQASRGESTAAERAAKMYPNMVGALNDANKGDGS